jgi:DNA-binding winged helix-turn-helix (wHTH) protein
MAAQQITSLQKPPEGWFWSPEARSRRRDMRAVNQLAQGGRNPWEKSEPGPRVDAVPTVTLPTLVPGRDKVPKACIFCRSRLLSLEEPLGQHQRGMLSCAGCGRQLAWLAPPMPSTMSRRPLEAVTKPTHGARSEPAVSTMRPALVGRFERSSGCGMACSVLYGHDATTHEQYGRKMALAEVETQPAGVVRTGALVVDFDQMLVSVDGREINPSDRELAILSYLAQRLGQTCSLRNITVHVWGYEYLEAWSTGSLNSAFHTPRINIARLRVKLGSARDLIETRIGIGYRLNAMPPISGDV